MSQQQRNEIFRTASSDEASQADDNSLLMMVSGEDGIEARTLRALRRTSKQLDGILRDLSKEISRQSANPVEDYGDAEMSDDEEHGEKQLKVELDSTILPNSEFTLKAANPRKRSKATSREIVVTRTNPTLTPSQFGTGDVEQPEQHREANSRLPAPESPLNHVNEKPHEDAGPGENTFISEQEKSIHEHAGESYNLTSGDPQGITTEHSQGSTDVKALHKLKLLKWILCLCLLFVSCVGAVLVVVVMLPHGTESTKTPMVAVPTTSTSSISTISPKANATSGMEESIETQMPTIWPTTGNMASLNSKSHQDDQSSPSSSPVVILDRQEQPPMDDERLDIVPKGFDPKKGQGNRR